MNRKIVTGVDIGGTTMTAGIVADSEILEIKTVRTERTRRPEDITASLITIIEDVSTGHSLSGIGIGVPCPAGPETETLYLANNLPTMADFPLRKILEDHFALPVIMENDANCMALGEQRAGALKGCSECVCITLGTGLGCGIIIGGKVYSGARYQAGEIWNIPLEGDTLLENRVSISALEKIYLSITGCKGDPQHIYNKYLESDSAAIETFNRYGIAVGTVVVMILTFLDPQKIALGGGISQSFDAFKNSMFDTVETTCGYESAKIIVPAELSEKAAIIGAASLINE